MASELEGLREIYLQFISEMVSYDERPPRPRYRHPQWYERIPTTQGIDINNLEPHQKVWVWSDLHFGHRNIIKFSDRPFINVEEMDQHLVDNFNEYVAKDDISIWVGDVSFRKIEATNEILDRCNGYKILVVGNHDLDKGKVRDMNFDETHLIYMVKENDVNLVFTHFPMLNLPAPFINVHGHVHKGSSEQEKNYGSRFMNVNCEFHNYRPITLDALFVWARLRRQWIEGI